MNETQKWSLKHTCCKKCGTNIIKHVARGLCLNCYQQETNKKNRGDSTIELVSQSLTHEYLCSEYINKQRSLGDIAKDCNCSRVYVYNKMKALNIPLRNKQRAREIALAKNKLEFTRFEENGSTRVIKLQKNFFDKNFFKNWSNEMAYVLGVIYTDGNLDPSKKLDASRKTTLNTPRLTIAQKEPELLLKVLKLMKCNAKLYHHDIKYYNNNICGDIYYFHVHGDELYTDLQKYGLTHNKSLTIDFPQIPDEYLGHFIRGCWDGDGSVYVDSSGRIVASYVSGSKIFVNKLVLSLQKLGLPLKTVYVQKQKNYSYQIKYWGNECLKLYDIFYNGVNEDMYLTRKYKVFKDHFKI